MTKLNVAEMNERVEAKLKELKRGRAKTERAHKIVSKVDARVDELRDELKQTRQELDHRRAVVKEVREDLHVAELEEEIERLRAAAGEVSDGPVEGDADGDGEQISQLGAHLDSLSGLIEEGVATRDRLLDRLDRLRDRQAEAEKVLGETINERDEDREALKRIRARRKKIKDREDRPSAHFAYAEFDCRNGQELPKAAEPAVKDWCERIGEPLRKRFGPVHINSGYRPATYNASVGGEQNSVHIYDYPGRNFATVAVDITCETGSPEEWYAFTTGKADGRGIYATFHHADTRSRIGWP
ncbi:MAG TPA: D-Ala-D-Ala carboxypeptidase family metallohydrolase, partial [Actinomycetota bacterium]|nr:D-Ala-D-Ala carboxypeptidase family metallohydrolase [Actinomycetota bacterium]